MSRLAAQTILIAANQAFPLHDIGRPRTPHHVLVEIFSQVLRTGMQWRAISSVDFRTAHRHFYKWAQAGVFHTAFRRLRRLVTRSTRRVRHVAVDTTFVKSIYGSEMVGPNPTDRGRNATKMIAAVDRLGLPQRIAFFPANVSDHRTLPRIVPLPRQCRGARVYTDKGFDSASARRLLRKHGYVPRIARRRVRTSARDQSMRHVVERFFSWLDKSRRIILRYDATIAAFSGWTWMACCTIAARRIHVDGS